MKLYEVVGGIVWGACTVSVAGYTWKAYTGTRSPFPTVTGGFGGAAVGINTVAEGEKLGFEAVGAIPVVGKPLAGFANWLQRLFHSHTGVQSLTLADIKRLQQLPAPPAAMVTAIKQANSGDKTKLAPAANALLTWGRSHGWSQSDVSLYLRYVGVHIF